MTQKKKPIFEAPQDSAVRQDAEHISALFPSLMVEAQKISQTISSGFHGRRSAGTGETFWQHRPYMSGDSINAIDWRQSARAEHRLYIRENEWEAAASIWIWSDPASSFRYTSSKILPNKRYRADVLATALTILLSEAGERIGFLDGSQRLFQGRTAPARMLEVLLSESRGHSVPNNLQLTPGSKVILMSDFFNNSRIIANYISSLARLGVEGIVFQVVDPAEEDFPFKGRTEFEDYASVDRLIFGHTQSVRAEYRAAFAAHRDQLSRATTQAGWTMLTHRTDKPTQAALLSLYTTMSSSQNNTI